MILRNYFEITYDQLANKKLGENKIMTQKILRPKVIGEKAVKEVIKFEERRGWKATDVSTNKNYGYDVNSVNKQNKSQHRCIEVKGKIGTKLSFISLYIKLREKLGKDKNNYYIYLVQNIETRNPEIKVIGPDVIFKNLKIKKTLILEPKYYRNSV